MVSLLDSAVSSLFATLFPSGCRFCSTPLNQISRIPVCKQCLDSVRTFDAPVCQVCGAELAAAAGERLCVVCQQSQPEFGRALACGRYDGTLRDLIHLLKYERVRPVAGVLGRMLAAVARDVIPPPAPDRVLVTAVPLHARKLRQRGFNQAELLARQMVRCCGGAPLVLEPKLLKRTRFTESQTGLSGDQRRANLKGAFSVAHPTKVAERHVLLVDDVYTTGTTVGECARVLRRAGAVSVGVVTVARAMMRDASPPDWAEGIDRDENLAMGSASVSA